MECRFEIPESVDVRAMQQLQHDNGDFVRRSLFDFVPSDLNSYEKSVALGDFWNRGHSYSTIAPSSSPQNRIERPGLAQHERLAAQVGHFV